MLSKINFTKLPQESRQRIKFKTTEKSYELHTKESYKLLNKVMYEWGMLVKHSSGILHALIKEIIHTIGHLHSLLCALSTFFLYSNSSVLNLKRQNTLTKVTSDWSHIIRSGERFYWDNSKDQFRLYKFYLIYLQLVCL